MIVNPSMGAEQDYVLDVRNLSVEFRTDRGVARAVDEVSWSIRRGRILALVGESGCGKSVTALSVLRLIPDPPGKIAGGEILFRDTADSSAVDLTQIADRLLRRIRGNRISMIFQEPVSALNPVLTVGDQIAEAVILHRKLSRREAKSLAIELLERVGISEPRQRFGDYPHRLSGGMCQRVMIAMALSCKPALLIADEPTTALDVTIQAQILDLLNELRAGLGMTILLITHDLGVVAQVADDVAVMYAGRIVERAGVHELFRNPLHPYTRALLECTPRWEDDRKDWPFIPGSVASPLSPPRGCRFHPRCRVSSERAARADREGIVADLDHSSIVLRRCVEPTALENGGQPPLREAAADHWVACWEA